MAIIFDLLALVPLVQKTKTNPITKKPFEATDLKKVNFSFDDNNQIHCPVTLKPFTQNSKIVIIKTTGNVFSFEAFKELNIDQKNYRDLLNDEKFDPKEDVLLVNDPQVSFMIPQLFEREKDEGNL